MTSMISQNEQKENQFSTTVDNFFKTFKIDSIMIPEIKTDKMAKIS